MANHRPSQAKDEEKPTKATPPAPAPPKPKPKLSQEDKVKLGKALAPALKPSIKVMSDQIQAAEKKPDELHSVIGEGCVPQIESLAALITEERDKIVEDNENEYVTRSSATLSRTTRRRSKAMKTGERESWKKDAARGAASRAASRRRSRALPDMGSASTPSRKR